LLLYYITGRTQFSGTESARRNRLLARIADAAHCGIDFIQLREKDLSARHLEDLAKEAMQAVQENSRIDREGERRTRLLINSRSDIAIAVEADGVHLRSEDISPTEVRAAWQTSLGEAAKIFPVVAVSCHTETEVARAAAQGADFAVLAPIFEKEGSTSGTGLDVLHRASHYNIPVFALGGVTPENIAACLNNGAAGVAGIRLFQENDIAELVSRLRRD
jgi:thiamine-phosphate pyrophosphorylase